MKTLRACRFKGLESKKCIGFLTVPNLLTPRAISPSDSSRIMQTVKTGWARQTFALAAKSNDKVEKKSGVRLSKKDRRVMVESFIKTYQKLNSGSFPSIHVTHKEVGGSYYIVRDIVRDIIQENKVLAPPKLLEKEHRVFNSLPGDYPLGSIFMEPQVSLTPMPNGVHESDHRFATEDLILESEKLTDQIVDDNLYIGQNAKASLSTGEHESDHGAETEELILKLEELTDQIMVDNLYTGQTANASLLMPTGEHESDHGAATEELILESGKLADQNIHDNPYIGLNASAEKPEELVKEDLGVNKSLIDDSKEVKLVETVEQEELSVGMDSKLSSMEVETFPLKVVNEPATSSNTHALKNLNGTSNLSVTEFSRKEASMDKYEAFQSTENGKDDLVVKSAEQEATKSKDEAVQSSTDHHRDGKPTLARMNLESWEEISKKPAHEGNPFTGFVKACVSAISKLFSK